MLEQLDNLPEVQSSSSNYSGMALRISLNKDAHREAVAQAAMVVLTKQGARPARLGEMESIDAIANDEWRGIDRINELSTIEFRTVSVDTLKQYAIDEKMSPEAISELAKIAEQTWDDHLKSVDQKVPPHKADWNGHCHSVALAFIENAKHLLSEKQIEQLKEMVRIEMPK